MTKSEEETTTRKPCPWCGRRLRFKAGDVLPKHTLGWLTSSPCFGSGRRV